MFEKTLNELIRGIRAHPDTEVTLSLTHSLPILDWKCVKLIRLACVACVHTYVPCSDGVWGTGLPLGWLFHFSKIFAARGGSATCSLLCEACAGVPSTFNVVIGKKKCLGVCANGLVL